MPQPLTSGGCCPVKRGNISPTRVRGAALRPRGSCEYVSAAKAAQLLGDLLQSHQLQFVTVFSSEERLWLMRMFSKWVQGGQGSSPGVLTTRLVASPLEKR